MKKIGRVLVYVVLLVVGPGGLFLLAPASVHDQITEGYTFSSASPISIEVGSPPSDQG